MFAVHFFSVLKLYLMNDPNDVLIITPIDMIHWHIDVV